MGPFSVFLNISSVLWLSAVNHNGTRFYLHTSQTGNLLSGHVLHRSSLFVLFSFCDFSHTGLDVFPFPTPPLGLFFLIRVFLPLRLTGIAVCACVAQAGPKLAVQLRLALNFPSSCLHLPRTGISDIHHLIPHFCHLNGLLLNPFKDFLEF